MCVKPAAPFFDGRDQPAAMEIRHRECGQPLKWKTNCYEEFNSNVFKQEQREYTND